MTRLWTQLPRSQPNYRDFRCNSKTKEPSSNKWQWLSLINCKKRHWHGHCEWELLCFWDACDGILIGMHCLPCWGVANGRGAEGNGRPPGRPGPSSIGHMHFSTILSPIIILKNTLGQYFCSKSNLFNVANLCSAFPAMEPFLLFIGLLMNESFCVPFCIQERLARTRSFCTRYLSIHTLPCTTSRYLHSYILSHPIPFVKVGTDVN